MIVQPATSPRYRILETIGKGGMGEVCLADDLVLNRKVALKFLVSSHGDTGAVPDQLLHEARAAAALDHPFICKIYEVTELEGRLCIVMEYVAGETIERRLRRGPVPVVEALRLAEEIAEAIEAAHRRRLVHRDLKPANVIVTEDDHIKVMDFGLATRLPVPADGSDVDVTVTVALPESGVLRGTPAYMSPEQVRGDPVDHRSDIFAFGILLYELLSGTQPFRRAGIEATFAAILREEPADLHRQAPSVPKALGTIVAQMLAKEVDARHQSFGQVRLDLRRLSGELAATTPTDARPAILKLLPSDTHGSFVARESEQAELLRRMRQAKDGRGALMLLGGEAGVGKSRLADEALREARRLGFLTLVGRCGEQENAQPLIPYIEVLEEAAQLLPASVFRDAIGRSAPELARLLPELHRLFGELPAPLELPPDLQQRFLFNNIKEFLIRCSRSAPLVVFLDDLQWADESTLQLTQHLAPQLDKMPVLVLAAYRDPDPMPAAPRPVTRALGQLLQRVRGETQEPPLEPSPVTRVLDRLIAQRLAHLIQIGPLSEAKVGSLLARLGHGNPPPLLVRKFFEATGGNPFFVEELFRYLNEEQRLFDMKSGWRRDLDVEQIDVPPAVRMVITRRLQRVSTKTHSVLTAAAVMGPHFELDLLEAIAEVDSDTLAAALEQAERADLVKGPSGRQERRWRFAHHLVRQTLISVVPPHRRERLHLRIAEAMEQLSASARTFTSDIAHHLYCAGALADNARTARALIAAGDVAHDIYATGEAQQHYRRALEILHQVRDLETDRLRVQERLGDLLTLTGDRAGAMQHYRDVSDSHERSRSRVDQARLIRKTGTLHWQGGDRTEAAACLERALAALQGQGPQVELAHVYQELGLAAFRRGENEKAIDWAEQALAAAQAALAAASPVTPQVQRLATAAMAHANNTVGVSLARLGQLDAARERIEQSVAAAREYGLLDVACRAYANLGVLYGTLEPRRAIDASLTGLELATKIGAATLQPYMYANLAAAYCSLTDRCETEGLVAARAAVSLDRELGQLDHLAVPLIVIAQIHQCQGELQQAQDTYREALTFAEQIGEPQLLFPCYDGLATIHLDRGDTELAEQYLQKAQQVCQRAGVDPDSLLVLPFLC
jgi:adenylate cyclase